jgi:hypothetical protein
MVTEQLSILGAQPILRGMPSAQLVRRFSAVVVRRLQATRARLIEHAAAPAANTRSGMSHV